MIGLTAAKKTLGLESSLDGRQPGSKRERPQGSTIHEAVDGSICGGSAAKKGLTGIVGASNLRRFP